MAPAENEKSDGPQASSLIKELLRGGLWGAMAFFSVLGALTLYLHLAVGNARIGLPTPLHAPGDPFLITGYDPEFSSCSEGIIWMVREVLVLPEHRIRDDEGAGSFAGILFSSIPWVMAGSMIFSRNRALMLVGLLLVGTLFTSYTYFVLFFAHHSLPAYGVC